MTDVNKGKFSNMSTAKRISPGGPVFSLFNFNYAFEGREETR